MSFYFTFPVASMYLLLDISLVNAHLFCEGLIINGDIPLSESSSLIAVLSIFYVLLNNFPAFPHFINYQVIYFHPFCTEVRAFQPEFPMHKGLSATWVSWI